MAGLILETPRLVSGLGVALARAGLSHGEIVCQAEVFVLDWRNVKSFPPDAIAYFLVLTRRIRGMGAALVVCGPAELQIAEILRACPQLQQGPDFAWVKAETDQRHSPIRHAMVVNFNPQTGDGTRSLFEVVGAVFENFEDTRSVRERVDAAIMEIVQNVCRHSGAANAAASVAMLYRRRPAILQVGLADDGVGIANTIVSQEQHHDLGQFSDATVASVTIASTLSGRKSSADQTEGGGGFSRLLRGFVEETSGRILIRSGAALMTREPSSADDVVSPLTKGTGTQIRLEVPLLKPCAP